MCAHTYMHVSVYMYVYALIHIHVCVLVHTCRCIHIYTYTQYVHIRMHMCTSLCSHIYTHESRIQRRSSGPGHLPRRGRDALLDVRALRGRHAAGDRFCCGIPGPLRPLWILWAVAEVIGVGIGAGRIEGLFLNSLVWEYR